MSDYRDDTVETAVIGDELWGGFKGRLIEDYGHMAAALFVTIGVLHSEQAAATDAVIDRPVGMLVEQAGVAGEAFGAMRVTGAISEYAVIGDRVTDRLRAVLAESGLITDETIQSATDVIVESAMAGATTTGVLHAGNTLVESGRLSDALVRHASELVAESAVASESIADRLRAKGLLGEVATVSDEILGTHAAFGHVSESAVLSGEASGLLRAASLLEEVALADAIIVSDAVVGQAWVSEADNWAMSRYEPFGFEAAAVVGGVVYLAGPDGFFALDGNDELIAGQLLSGKIDAGDHLARPLNAYLEYTMDGSASMDVVQTQGGDQEQAWNYPLERGSVAVLTNSRIDFGRGLRGRHFTFALNLQAKRAYINDLTVLIEPGSRRV